MPCAEEEGVSEVERWEYLILQLTNLDSEFNVLQECGKAGWELCAVNGREYIFKRRKRE